MNIDQDSQFTAGAFTDAVLGRQLRLSVGGNGAWRDNVFVERTWRSIKYEEVHLKAYESVGHARCSITNTSICTTGNGPFEPGGPDAGRGMHRDAACDQIGSMIASDVPLKNRRKLSG
ncbi:integrase [Burkholderia pseudomallei]|uniref:integrase n=1 Tax=Burkholderia pseudomallei TaxID=28450 RepID=UPI000A1CD5FE|nr:integrase [Burkholderia pseudomallei]